MKRINRYLLTAAAALGLSMGVVSCTDNIDNNGGKTPENQEEIVQSKADKFWSVVSQLVSTDDYTPDYEDKTFEPVYGVAQEGDPTTRLVYTNDVATAAERFADIVEKEGIDENTQTYTFDDPDIGTLSYTKGDEDGAILATVDVDIKQIPSLKKIIYVPGGFSNGHFEGKAYYRFGDVVSRKTIDYDGRHVTEYWVCVRPAFGPEGKETSHWVCLNVLPKKNVYHYKGSNGTDYYLPTGIGTNKEHMQNLVEMLFAMHYPNTWYMNVTHYASSGLEMFHDFSAENIKYHNQKFWENVQKGWEENNIYELAMNLKDGDEQVVYDTFLEGIMTFLYSGYSWWTSTSWNCTLYTVNYDDDITTTIKDKDKNKHNAQYNAVKKDMRSITFDCRSMGSDVHNYRDFLGKDRLCWVVRHATGKELCANGRYDVKQPLNGCEEVYRYYRDVEPITDLSEDPEVTGDVSNAPTDGRGTYLPGDVVEDEVGNRWFCMTPSPWSQDMSYVKDHTAWFVSADFKEVIPNGDYAKYLPSEDELPELTVRLMNCFVNVAKNVDTNSSFIPGINGQLGNIMQHVKTYAGIDWLETLVYRDSTWTFTSNGKTYDSKSTSLMSNLAYRDNTGKIAVARVIYDNTQAGNNRAYCYAIRPDGTRVSYSDFFMRMNKYYHTYDSSNMRPMTDDEKYLGMNSWCLPWAVTSERMYLQDLTDQSKVDRYAKDDKWVTLPLYSKGANNTKREDYRKVAETSAKPEDFIGKYALPRSRQKLGMYNEPVLFLRVMKVTDMGGKTPCLTSNDHKELTVVHMQNNKYYYDAVNMTWLTGYTIGRKNFIIDNEPFNVPTIPGLENF